MLFVSKYARVVLVATKSAAGVFQIYQPQNKNVTLTPSVSWRFPEWASGETPDGNVWPSVMCFVIPILGWLFPGVHTHSVAQTRLPFPASKRVDDRKAGRDDVPRCHCLPFREIGDGS